MKKYITRTGAKHYFKQIESRQSFANQNAPWIMKEAKDELHNFLSVLGIRLN